MSATSFAWVFAAAGILAFLLNLAAIVFLLTKRSRFPRATGYALGGFGLILFGQIGVQLLFTMIGRLVTPDSIMIYNALAALAGTLVHFAGLCMLIVAVYVDRRYNPALPPGMDPIGRRRTSAEASNPYAV